MASIGDQLTNPEYGWKRIDDRHEYIKYKNLTSQYPQSECWSNTYSAIQADKDNEISIKFTGDRIRFIGSVNLPSYRCSEIRAYIDDELVGTFTQQASSSKHQILLFERTNLSGSVHTVRFVGVTKAGEIGTSSQIVFDCVDISESGKIVQQLGTASPYPESDWVRYDDSENLILYEGKGWKKETSNNSFGKTLTITDIANDFYKFNVLAKGFRLVTKLDNTYSANDNVVVYVDDVIVGRFNHNSSNVKEQILTYEHLFNEKGRHVVKVVNLSNKTNIDCIDVLDGSMLPTLSSDYEFPVATILKPDLEAYCNSLVNGEEQLLAVVDNNSFGLVLTNGNGGYLQFNPAT